MRRIKITLLNLKHSADSNLFKDVSGDKKLGACCKVQICIFQFEYAFCPFQDIKKLLEASKNLERYPGTLTAIQEFPGASKNTRHQRISGKIRELPKTPRGLGKHPRTLRDI